MEDIGSVANTLYSAKLYVYYSMGVIRYCAFVVDFISTVCFSASFLECQQVF